MKFICIHRERYRCRDRWKWERSQERGNVVWAQSIGERTYRTVNELDVWSSESS